jgi:membrane-bound serine protease (ClpP class)
VKRLAASALLVLCAAAAYADRPVVEEMTLEGMVAPLMADRLERGIAQATEDGASLLIVRLNTLGGRVDVPPRMAQAIERSAVPVVVWVAPKGATAASAGTFVTLAAHAAAMAPGTTIGAASPVDGSGRDLEPTLARKVTNLLVTQIAGLAARRGERAQRWAEDAVRNAVTASAEEALDLGVIDVVAADRDELLAKLEGRAVDVGQQSIALHLTGAEVREIEETWVESVLQWLADPTVAFVLLIVGLNGVLYEIASPGAVVPGVVGGISLLLAFYSLGVLPVNLAGLLLIVLAFVLFLVDVLASTHGVLTVGGIVALVCGAMVLFQSPLYEVSRSVIVGVAIATGLFFAILVGAAIRIRRRKPATGAEGMLGARGISRTPLEPEGMVMVEGELWSARADEALGAGVPVEVVAVDGMRLRVRRAEGGRP